MYPFLTVAEEKELLGGVGLVSTLSFVTCDKFNPANLLISGSTDGTIRSWNIDSGALVWQSKNPNVGPLFQNVHVDEITRISNQYRDLMESCGHSSPRPFLIHPLLLIVLSAPASLWATCMVMGWPFGVMLSANGTVSRWQMLRKVSLKSGIL